MVAFVRLYLVVFAVIAIAGGFMGYVKAKSKPSLIAGSVAAGLLAASAYLLGAPNAGTATAGLVVGLVTCVALAGRFVPAYVKTKKPMPAGMMAALSVLGIALIGLALAR